MSYISGFDYDIFISYAHVDNATADEGETGWITEFREHLDVQLSKRVGRIGAVKIWQDPKLEGGQLFDQTIQNSINTSALFLALTSTGYLASEYCRQEVKWFCQKAGTEPLGLAVGDRMRVFNLQLNNIPFIDWPTEFGRTSGFPLKQVMRLIIVFGEVTEDWVRERLNAAVQIAITERCPLKAFGIYFAGARRKGTDANFNFGFLPVYSFDNSDLQSPQKLAPFLEAS